MNDFKADQDRDVVVNMAVEAGRSVSAEKESNESWWGVVVVVTGPILSLEETSSSFPVWNYGTVSS